MLKSSSKIQAWQRHMNFVIRDVAKVSRALFKLLASDTHGAQPAGRLLLEWEKEVVKGLEVHETASYSMWGAFGPRL